jgi:hypothetical protein
MFKKIILGLFLLTSTALAQTSIIRQDSLKMGRGTATDKSIVFDKGSGATNPAIKWNNTSSALQFTNDGTNYLDFGSGSGGSGGYSVLVNGDFETGVSTGWTYSGATVTAATSGSNLLIGGKSAVFDATANNEYIQSSDYTLPNGLLGRNCYAQILYKGGDSNLSLQVLDGSDNVLGSTALVAATNPVKAYFNFICPTSGSIQLKVKASADAAAIALDSMFLGEAINIANISQAQAIVQAFRASSTQNVASTSPTVVIFNSETQDTNSEFNISTGVFTASSTKRLVISSDLYLGNQLSSEVFGLNVYKGSTEICSGINQTSASLVTNTGLRVTDCIVDVVAGDTIDIRVDSVSDASYDIINGTATRVVIKQFPTTQEMAIRPDLQFWKVDANISGANPSLGTSAVSSYTGIENGSLTLTNNSGQGNIAAQVPCSSTNAPSGTTCSAGNESVGVAFTPTGTFPQDVIACASFQWNSDTAAVANSLADATFQIIETPINAQTISQEGKSRMMATNRTTAAVSSGLTFPFRVCGTFTFTSGGQKALRLMFEQAIAGSGVTSSLILADAGASIGQRDVHWEVYPINQGIPAPILVGSVNSNSSGSERIERLLFSCTASSSITSQSGSWVTSVGNRSSASCTVNIASGIFSAAPVCVASRNNASANYISVLVNSATSITTTMDTAGDYAPNVICMGPR